MPKTILENENFLVINKPAGLVVHSDGKTKEPNLCDWLLENYPDTKGVGEPFKLNDGTLIDRPGIAHRLDRETSGVMIVARNQETFEYLKNLFKTHQIEKTYHAFVYGNIKEDSGTINASIGRNKNNFKQWQAGEKARGEMREATTEFKVLKRNADKTATFIQAKPKTGRTHQIRVHFKYIHHPLISDTLYAPNMAPLFDFNRTALHSYSIKFKAPDGAEVSCIADYPDDFSKALTYFK